MKPPNWNDVPCRICKATVGMDCQHLQIEQNEGWRRPHITRIEDASGNQGSKMTKPTPRQRLFTDEFTLGDRVCVIREEHGWHDGALEGHIVSMTETSCVVFTDDMGVVNINHPRDIYKGFPQPKKKEINQIIARYKQSLNHERQA